MVSSSSNIKMQLSSFNMLNKGNLFPKEWNMNKWAKVCIKLKEKDDLVIVWCVYKQLFIEKQFKRSVPKFSQGSTKATAHIITWLWEDLLYLKFINILLHYFMSKKLPSWVENRQDLQALSEENWKVWEGTTIGSSSG